MLEQVHLQIYGRVQMVGFRFFAVRTAEKYGISGYVRNRMDGSVEVLGQGEEKELSKFISRIKQGPSSAQVSSVEMNRTGDIKNHYSGFSVH